MTKTQSTESSGNTIKLHRILTTTPEKIWRAYTARFDNPHLPGEMTTRVTLRAVSVGTEFQVTQSGIPVMIPTEACYLGWQESLRNLARLVEPNIPG